MYTAQKVPGMVASVEMFLLPCSTYKTSAFKGQFRLLRAGST